jgi:hypothetical protein
MDFKLLAGLRMYMGHALSRPLQSMRHGEIGVSYQILTLEKNAVHIALLDI